MDIVITKKEEIKKILQTHPFIIKNSKEWLSLWSYLSSYYKALTPQEKEYINFYANVMWRLKKHNIKKRSRFDIIFHPPGLYRNGYITFVALNFVVLYRNITDKVRKNVWIGHPAMAPPSLLSCTYQNNKITLIWKDYIPPVGKLAGMKVFIYHSIFARYIIHLQHRTFKKRVQLIGTYSQPTPQKLILQYLPLSSGSFVKVSDIHFGYIYFQMETICLVEDFLPIISFPSNVCGVEINNKYSIKEYEENIKRLVGRQRLVEAKPPLFQEGIVESNYPELINNIQKNTREPSLD